MFTMAPPKPRRNEVSASGDFFLGQGKVTLPFGFSLHLVPGLAQNVTPKAASATRSSDYFGGTISYSFLHEWFVDFAYANGTSSGNPTFSPLISSIPAHFTINDQWYQAYIRYTFPALRGKPFSAYLRAGGTYITANLNMSHVTAAPFYQQTDHTTDYRGNLGFGLTYRIPLRRRMFLGFQFEGEGFYGRRSQDSTESLPPALPYVFPTAHINNTLYGGIVRATIHYEYNLSASGFFKLFADGGFQGEYTDVQYPGTSAPNELLYGPYAKLGLSYQF